MYERYYEKRGADRNDLLTNPGVAFQVFACERANIRALRGLDLNRETARVLDVGSGEGASLLQFIKLGFRPENLAGVDNGEERVARARTRFPNIDFRLESAEKLSFADATFDLVFESTLFMMLTNEDEARRIASEMLRVTRPGGYVMLADWRYAEPRSTDHRAMSAKRIAALFSVGGKTRIVAREQGALVPPVGRFFSRRLPAFYFVAQRLMPFAVGQVTTVLQKI